MIAIALAEAHFAVYPKRKSNPCPRSQSLVHEESVCLWLEWAEWVNEFQIQFKRDEDTFASGVCVCCRTLSNKIGLGSVYHALPLQFTHAHIEGNIHSIVKWWMFVTEPHTHTRTQSSVTNWMTTLDFNTINISPIFASNGFYQSERERERKGKGKETSFIILNTIICILQRNRCINALYFELLQWYGGIVFTKDIHTLVHFQCHVYDTCMRKA